MMKVVFLRIYKLLESLFEPEATRHIGTPLTVFKPKISHFILSFLGGLSLAFMINFDLGISNKEIAELGFSVIYVTLLTSLYPLIYNLVIISLIILSASTMLFTLRVEEHARCLVQEMKEKWIVRNYYLVTFFVAFTTTFLLTFFIREHGTGWHAIIGWCINFSAVATEMMFFGIASHVILDLLVDKFAIFLLKRKKRN